ncbi:GNAT family N-acetyltransferase [Pedobacter sp. UC225_61]|uniref:GNAT family N-acetyltransferase n=1 Tax=Pedobacter sp. UC225_61 TaxID=3374623 RepID=UPI0037AA0834
MIDAKTADKDLVVDILLNTFAENKSVNYIAPTTFGDRRKRALMEYAFDLCMLFGKVRLSDDRRGCALLVYPDWKRTSWRSFWLDLKLAFGLGLFYAIRAMRRESKVAARQFSGKNVAYLWFIGVEQGFQNQGVGSKLLSEVILMCGRERRMVCLETSTLENLPWYGNFGFRLYAKLDLGYELFFLRRELD